MMHQWEPQVAVIHDEHAPVLAAASAPPGG
jgi:hypothetical protein